MKSAAPGARGGAPLRSSSWVRVVAIALGLWLFVSAFAWPHAGLERLNAWIVGLVAMIVGLVAIFVNDQARFLASLLSIWLFVSAFVVPGESTATVWNAVVVAVVSFVLSIVPGGTFQPHAPAPAGT